MKKILAFRIAIIAIVAIGFIGYKVFFVDDDEVIKFNDTLVDMLSKSDARYEPMTGLLDKYYDGIKIDMGLMAEERGKLENSVREDQNLLKSMKIPDDELCKEFHTGCVNYIGNSLLITEKYKGVIEYISEHNPGSEADGNAIESMLKNEVINDDKLWETVVASQKRLAEEFDFELR